MAFKKGYIKTLLFRSWWYDPYLLKARVIQAISDMQKDKRLEQRLRKEIVYTNRVCVESGLICSSDGNISIRLEDDRFLVTPSGLYKRRLKPKQLLIVNYQGEVIKGKGSLRPSSELLMHLEAYRQREDIRAVLHAHPPYSTALTIAGIRARSNVVSCSVGSSTIIIVLLVSQQYLSTMIISQSTSSPITNPQFVFECLRIFERAYPVHPMPLFSIDKKSITAVKHLSIQGFYDQFRTHDTWSDRDSRFDYSRMKFLHYTG